jgi:hypothetical protein
MKLAKVSLLRLPRTSGIVGGVVLIALGIRYEERGPAVSEEAKSVRARNKMIREMRSVRYRVELAQAAPTA